MDRQSIFLLLQPNQPNPTRPVPCRGAPALLPAILPQRSIIFYYIRFDALMPRPPCFGRVFHRAAYQQGEDQQHQQSEQRIMTDQRGCPDVGKDTGLLSAAADLVRFVLCFFFVPERDNVRVRCFSSLGDVVQQ